MLVNTYGRRKIKRIKYFSKCVNFSKKKFKI